MHYLSVFDHKTNKRIAFLENAYNVGYTQEQNALWTAQFTLPLQDAKNRYCQYFNFVEIYDGDKYIGLFRIVPTTVTKSADCKEIALTSDVPSLNRSTGITDADTNYNTVMARGIYAGTADMTAGSSALTSGVIYLVYE